MNDLQDYMMNVNKPFLGHILGKKNTAQVCSNKNILPSDTIGQTLVYRCARNLHIILNTNFTKEKTTNPEPFG